MILRFLFPGFFWLLLLLPVCFLFSLRSKGIAFPAKVFFAKENSALFHPVNYWHYLMLLALFFIIFALCRPVLQTVPLLQDNAESSMIFVLDMSNSMKAVDLAVENNLTQTELQELFESKASRLHLARKAIEMILQEKNTGRLALLAFARDAYLICPLTKNKQLLLQRLNELQSEDFADGTAVAQAIIGATKALQPEKNNKQKEMIIFSDGADNSSSKVSPTQAAELATAENIKIHCIGIGSKNNGWQEINSESGKKWQKIADELDEKTLQKIADISQGTYNKMENEKDIKVIEKLLQKLNYGKKNPENKARDITKYLIIMAALTMLSAAYAKYKWPLVRD